MLGSNFGVNPQYRKFFLASEHRERSGVNSAGAVVRSSKKVQQGRLLQYLYHWNSAKEMFLKILRWS